MEDIPIDRNINSISFTMLFSRFSFKAMAYFSVIILLLVSFSFYSHLGFASLDVSDRSNPEFRGLWAPRWDVNTQAEVDQAVAATKASNCNALLLQVRGEGYSLYNSSYDPMYPSVPDGFDPLFYAITKCHEEGIELHAWMNVFASGSAANMDSYPADHVMKEHPEWISIDSNGFQDSQDYIFIEPAQEDVKGYLLNLTEEIVANYDIDGLHFDYVRYEGTKFGYGDDCKTSFETMYNTTWSEGSDWNDFRRGHVTAFVERAFWLTKEIKPHIRLGAAVWGINGNGFDQYFQDSLYWAQEGFVDYLAPMTYYTDTQLFTDSIRDYISGSLGTDIYGGIGVYKFTPGGDSAGMVNQVEITRNEGCKGQVFFSMAYLRDNPSFQTALTSGPFNAEVNTTSIPDFHPVGEPTWEFNNDWLRSGWETRNMDVSYPLDGIWRGDVGYDPMLISPEMNISSETCNFLEVRMRNFNHDKTAKLYFQRDVDDDFHEDLHISFPLVNGSYWHTYRTRLSSNELWEGPIKRLRFDPVSFGDAEIAIDFIHIIFRPECIKSWLLSQRYQSDSASNALAYEFLNDTDSVIPGPGMEAGGALWTLYDSSEDYIDLKISFADAENCALYSHIFIHSNSPQPALLKLGSDDGIKVWLNGEELYSNDVLRGASPDQDQVRCNLSKGINRLMMKISQGSGEWGFYARFTDLFGLPLEDLDYILDLGPLEPPEIMDELDYWWNESSPSFAWEPVSNALVNISGYEWELESLNLTMDGFTEDSEVRLPLLPNDHYTLSINSIDEIGRRSLKSDISFGIDTAVPETPGIMPDNVISSNGSIKWQWERVSHGISGIQHYDIILEANGGLVRKTLKGNTYSANLLTQGIYSLRVRAQSRSGTVSDWGISKNVTVDKSPPTAPGIPIVENITENGSLFDVQLSWCSSEDALTDIYSYSIEIITLTENSTEGDWNWIANTTMNSSSISLPPLKGQYIIRVKALDRAGWWSDYSDTMSFQLLMPEENHTEINNHTDQGNETQVEENGTGESGIVDENEDDSAASGSGDPNNSESGSTKKPGDSSFMKLLTVIFALIIILVLVALVLVLIKFNKKNDDIEEDLWD